MCRGVFLRISRCLPFLRRLLLISSGEVLKFDFPEALDEPNCIPTAEAMHWALPTGDHARVFPPDNTEDSTPASVEPLCPNDPYITALARDIPRAKAIVTYTKTCDDLARYICSDRFAGAFFRELDIGCVLRQGTRCGRAIAPSGNSGRMR